MLEAKAQGYRQLMESCAGNPRVAPTLLMIEQLPELVAMQVKAIQNLKIVKITVWDSGAAAGDGKGNATANFLSGMIGSLPQVHELAKQAGIELPSALGHLSEMEPEAVETVQTKPSGENETA